MQPTNVSSELLNARLLSNFAAMKQRYQQAYSANAQMASHHQPADPYFMNRPLPPQPLTPCPLCTLRFTSLSSLTLHIQHDHATQQPTTTEAAHFCDVCQLACDTEAQLAGHVAGMKHRRKAEVRNSFLQQFDNLPKHSIVTVSDRLWMCLLCRAALDGEHAVLQHLGTAKHRKQQIAQEAGLVDGTGGGDHVLGEEEVGNFNGAPLSASATIGKARSGKQTCGSGGDMFACEECAICCNSKEMLNVHLKSAKHKRKVEGVGIDLTMRCEICQVSCCGAANYAAHLKGKLHAKTIRRNEEAKNDKDLCETGINV